MKTIQNTNIRIFLCVLMLGTLFSCKKDEGSSESETPVASFTASATEVEVGGKINFTDNSTGNPTEWEWTFSGANPASSTDQNPKNIEYNTEGTFKVTLTVKKAGKSNTSTKDKYIKVSAKPVRKPTVTTTDYSNITTNSVSTGGNVTDEGTSPLIARGVCWSTTSNPTLESDTTFNGNTTGVFTSNLSGLSPNTTYYIRAYATNNSGTSYGNEISFKTKNIPLSNPYLNPDVTYGSLTDVEGNKYATVQIGTQIWMAENLKVSKYNDGTEIPNITDDAAWGWLTYGAWRYYNHDSSNNQLYGKLYNYNAVKTAKLCPTGWHIPTEDEWLTLSNYLGGSMMAGKKMKSTIGWSGTVSPSTNESGFSALPGGYYGPYGLFYAKGSTGVWWSSTIYIPDYSSYYRALNSNSDELIFSISYDYKLKDAFSCRCVKN